MTTLSIQNNNISFSKNVFSVSGKEAGFATCYKVVNEKTGNSEIFNFVESTGSEWDANTFWIYRSKGGLQLNVSNNDVTPQHIENYLNAKLRN